MTNTRQLNPSLLRAMLQPDSWNEEARTIDVVFATSTPVLRYDWDGTFNEVLSMDPSSVRLERINAGAPVLNSHNSWELEDQIGVVERAWVESGQCRATVKLSARESIKGIVEDIKSGIIRNISVGYRVYAYELAEKGDVPTFRAVDWEPYEISFVAVPADHNSKVRSKSKEIEPNDVIINASLEEESQTQLTEMQVEDTNKQLPDNTAEVQRAAIEQERKRTADIISAVRKANLSNDFAQKLIEDGTTIDAARAAILDEMERKDVNIQSTAKVSGQDEQDKKRSLIQEAFQSRAMGTPIAGAAREYRGKNLLGFAAEFVEMAGGNTRGMTPREIAMAALGMKRAGGMHTTSDFPLILEDTINKTLLASYELSPNTFAAWTRQSSASDFKQISRTRLSEAPSLEEVVEGGEYKYGNFGESKEAYVLKKYGKIIPVSWEMIINDDMGAFNRIPAAMADEAMQLHADIVWGILTGNPNMSDGNALFSTQHSNVAASGGAINLTTLNAARAAMRKQKGLKGSRTLNLTPAFLLVGPDKELEAFQFTSSNYVPDQAGNVNNPFQGLQVIVDPRLTGNQWYLAAMPNRIDTIEYAYLDGEGAIFTDREEGFDIDGLKFKVRSVFGAKAIDWRGLYKNAGA